MKNEMKKYAGTVSADRVNRFKTAVMLLPFAGFGLAGADGVVDDMSSKATAATGSISTAVGTVLGALLLIALGFLAYNIFKKPKSA